MRDWLPGILLGMALNMAGWAQQAPLIDRELFFGDPEISGAQISPDGKYLAFIKPWKGTRNVWVKPLAVAFDQARLVTADTRRPIPGYFWSRDSKYILFVQDQAGDENYNVYAVEPSALPAAGAPTAPARNLTEAKGVRATIHALPKGNPDALYVGLNNRDRAWHDLYRVKISTGERSLVVTNTERLVSYLFDLQDRLRLAVRTTPAGQTEILRERAGKWEKIFSTTVFETCEPIRFHRDNRRLYLATNAGEDVDLSRLLLLDTETAQTEVVEGDPLRRVDFGGAIVSELTDELLGTTYLEDKVRVHWWDKAYEADYNFLKQKFAGLEISFGSHTKDEKQWLIQVFSDTEPGETWLFNRTTREVVFQYRVWDKLPRAQLAPVLAIRFPSSDGLEIPAYLTLPRNLAAKDLPLVVTPHGGPWARDAWGYAGFAQFLANRGYAVLKLNFRGSTGYGKKFLNAGNLQWGGKMQDDITWGVKHLVQRGVADPHRVGIMGISYGGYATLAGVAFTPDLYAAAVAVVAPSHLITLLESIPPYWESMRMVFYTRMGDPRTPEGRAQLERQSPLNSAAKIKTPLLVVQGANDPRVNQRESDQIVAALRDRGFPVEYLVAPDEGHGFARPVNNLAMFAATEKFLARHLGGRCQEGGSPEVVRRLQEITVDPRTVVVPARLDPGAVGVPKVAGPILPGIHHFLARLKMGAQTMDLKVTTVITDTPETVDIEEAIAMPMGETKDRVVLAKPGLTLLKREINQGSAQVTLVFRDNQVMGNIQANGQASGLKVDAGGLLFAEGASGPFAIASLPLAEGYTTAFRVLDVQKQKIKLMQLKVAGIESVTVAAGTFNSYRVEVSSTDGTDQTTLWISRDSRQPVKVAASMAQMAGATMTLELQ